MDQAIERFCAIGGLVRRDCTVAEKTTCFYAHAFDARSMVIAEGVSSGLTKAGFGIDVPAPSATHHGLLFCGVICGRMRRCHVFLADVTHPNPNVYFELGYAEASGRLCFLFRDAGAKVKSTFLSEAGIYINEFRSSQDIVDHVVNCRGDLDRAAAPLFPSSGHIVQPESAALFVPNLTYYESDVRVLIERFLGEVGMSLAVAPSYGIRAARDWAMIEAAEWVIGLLASDEAENASVVNCDVAFKLGMAVALGKKALVLQEEPSVKPMIDLAGLLERYSSPKQIHQHLANRLKPSRTAELKREFDDLPRAGLERDSATRMVDSAFSDEQLRMISEMTGERQEDMLPKSYPDQSTMSSTATPTESPPTTYEETKDSVDDVPQLIVDEDEDDIDIGQSEEFQLSPSGLVEDDDDSGSQIIELEDDDDFDAPNVFSDDELAVEKSELDRGSLGRKSLLTRLTDFMRRRPN